MKKHNKHAKITKSNIGVFHQNEYAILGTPCGNIKKMAYAIIEELQQKYRLGYVDADHKSSDTNEHDPNSAISFGAHTEYVDKIDFHRFDSKANLNEFDFKQVFLSSDAVLVNGNHFKAKQQIAVIDSKKPLSKKLEKLTNVICIVFQSGETEMPTYLQEHLPNIAAIPAFNIDDINGITNLIANDISARHPLLKGLVLAGGKSQRMQRDKGKIQYHGTEQRLYMQNILTQYTNESYLSIRSEQKEELDNKILTIEDKFIGLGPYGAILSAFQQDPNSAWLVTACDQPLLNEETIAFLIANRDSSKLATAFYNSETEFPEPLITIWEPRAYARLLYFLSLGYSCPRKVLINSDINIVKLADETVLKNANTPEEFETLSGYISKA